MLRLRPAGYAQHERELKDESGGAAVRTERTLSLSKGKSKGVSA